MEARLASLKTRGDIKDLGDALDRDAALRASFVTLAEKRGHAIDDEMSGKRIVRLLLDRADAAQVRKNPIHRDESFVCAHCGREVPKGGAPVRDHCPWCLRGLHVDVIPGDRAAGCGGVLDPIGFERRPEIVIRYRCRTCAHAFTVRAHPGDAIPPSLDPRDVDRRPTPPARPSEESGDQGQA
ncbi:MAG: RNHCP domain-containing protein [Myxococcota bacterium]